MVRAVSIAPSTWLATLIWSFVKACSSSLALSGSAISHAWLMVSNSTLSIDSTFAVKITDFTVRTCCIQTSKDSHLVQRPRSHFGPRDTTATPRSGTRSNSSTTGTTEPRFLLRICHHPRHEHSRGLAANETNVLFPR
ncbi:hypothetical protein BD311DRAFT_456824 [Dichomitus squalens]|uniref:Secreted protein n=1 Tax=Dichomitus squalens TaxID=114155 RepID=A0A4V6MVV7_9APHY|nr:hypothetical protein BD311DRAFT_456824 [Dichomitus squalens]